MTPLVGGVDVVADQDVTFRTVHHRLCRVNGTAAQETP
jgi:hypothetical protein